MIFFCNFVKSIVNFTKSKFINNLINRKNKYVDEQRFDVSSDENNEIIDDRFEKTIISSNKSCNDL